MWQLYLKFEKPITNFEIVLQKIFFYGASFTAFYYNDQKAKMETKCYCLM